MQLSKLGFGGVIVSLCKTQVTRHIYCCYRARGVVHDKLLQKKFPLSVSGGSSPQRPPARFAMPAARGKTSLNARDW